MADFKKRFGGGDRGGKFGGHRGGEHSNFGRPRGAEFDRGHGGNRDFGRPTEMHQATCADCGNKCEVPFRPNGERPVYCRDCFGGKKESQPRDFGKREFTPRPSFAAPAAAPAPINDRRIDEFNKQFELVHAKLDKLARLLEGVPSVSAPVAIKAVNDAKPVEVKAKKEVAKAAPKKADAKKKVAKKK